MATLKTLVDARLAAGGALEETKGGPLGFIFKLDGGKTALVADSEAKLETYLYNYLGLGRRRVQDELYLNAMKDPKTYLERKEDAVQRTVKGLSSQLVQDVNEYIRLGYSDEAALKEALQRSEKRYKLEEERIKKEFPTGLTEDKLKAIAAGKSMP